MDKKGNPADRSKTGGWTAATIILVYLGAYLIHFTIDMVTEYSSMWMWKYSEFGYVVIEFLVYRFMDGVDLK